MKKKYIVIINFIIILVNIIESIHNGYFRDNYNVTGTHGIYDYFFWISLFLSIILLVLNISNNYNSIMIITVLLCFLNIIIGIAYSVYVSDYTINYLVNIKYIVL